MAGKGEKMELKSMPPMPPKMPQIPAKAPDMPKQMPSRAPAPRPMPPKPKQMQSMPMEKPADRPTRMQSYTQSTTRMEDTKSVGVIMPSIDEMFDHCEHIAKALPAPMQSLLDKVSKALKIPRSKCIAGFMFIGALYMIFGYFAAFICNFVGFVLPAYWSMGAIETSNKDDDTKWLTYWVVFAAFSCVDFFADAIFAYFPFYWLFKVIFLAWCFAPVANNGSQKIYTKILRPYFLKRQDVIDKHLQKGADVVNNLVKMD